MVTVFEKISAVKNLRDQLARLELDIDRERARELAELPEKYGFSTTETFLAAVERAVRTTESNGEYRRLSKTERRTMRDQLLAGKLTYAAAADKYRCSISTVYNVKKEAKRKARL